jgi:Domain of unknown function (DUF5615)
MRNILYAARIPSACSPEPTDHMGTLASELGPHAERLSSRPRVYADANVPAGLVGFMRDRLQWDVLFVLEHDELRRARDIEHYRLARQLRRTLVTLDRDYLNDRRFPPAEGAGVVVISAPHERGLARLLGRIDRALFRAAPVEAGTVVGGSGLPLEGRKLHAHADWTKQPVGP